MYMQFRSFFWTKYLGSNSDEVRYVNSNFFLICYVDDLVCVCEEGRGKLR